MPAVPKKTGKSPAKSGSSSRVREKKAGKPASGMLNEPMAVYGALSPLDKISMARKGVSKKQLSYIKDEVSIGYDQLSKILATSRASLISKKGAQKFNRDTSERILMLKDVISYGYEVFGDKEAFNEWLKTPSAALGKVSPLSLMDTFYGIEEVKKELGRIAYGIY